MIKINKYIPLMIMGIIICSIFYFQNYIILPIFLIIYIIFLFGRERIRTCIIKKYEREKEEYSLGLKELNDQYKIMCNWFKNKINIKPLVFFLVFQTTLIVLNVIRMPDEISIIQIIAALTFWIYINLVLYCTPTGLSVFYLTTYYYIKSIYLFKACYVSYIKNSTNMKSTFEKYAKNYIIYIAFIERCSKDEW